MQEFHSPKYKKTYIPVCERGKMKFNAQFQQQHIFFHPNAHIPVCGRDKMKFNAQF
jgi:hypothetical protein